MAAVSPWDTAWAASEAAQIAAELETILGLEVAAKMGVAPPVTVASAGASRACRD